MNFLFKQKQLRKYSNSSIEFSIFFILHIFKQHNVIGFPFFFCIFYLQKNTKTSPRWQHSEAKNNKETKTVGGDIVEDERDPDVIPAQYGNFS